MKIKRIYLNLIGIVIFVIILSRLDLLNVFKILKSMNILFFVIACFFLMALLIIKVIRWHYLIKIQGIDYSFKDAFFMYASGMYVGLITPGRMGELAKLFYLKEKGYSTGKSFLGVFLDRLSDFLFLILFGYIGMFFFFTFFKKAIYFLSVLVIVGLIFIIFVRRYSLRTVLKKLFYRLIPEKYKDRTKINFYDFYYDLKKFSKKNFLIVTFLTLISWLFYYTEMYFLANGIGIEISFFYLAICVSIAGVITLLPISISGIGTRDITLITLFSFLAISKESAVAMSFLILLMSVIMAIIGLICWFKKPIRLSKSFL